MARWHFPPHLFAWILLSFAGHSFGQIVPDAPAVPVCNWEGIRSNCQFKDALQGTPTSVSGNRVIVFRFSKSGGEGTTRTYLDDAIKRLAARYFFTATITEDPSVFSAANLANAKVVIMSNGDGDVLPAGPQRTALEEFQQVHGWGVIWIHAACAFISSAWPFGQQSCVQQYFHHNPAGTVRRIFIDSGTATNPSHGIKNPQTEFLLRSLPGWGSQRALELADKWFCFQAPARDVAGVNVLFGMDHSSGLPGDQSCPGGTDSSETGSQLHNLAWTHQMGKGITIYQSWGHDEDVYTDHGNMGDSLLWRYLRYAAKDWCVTGTSACEYPDSSASMIARGSEAIPETRSLRMGGVLALSISDPGPYTVSLLDVRGRRVFSESRNGPGEIGIPGLSPGLYLVRISGKVTNRIEKIMAY